MGALLGETANEQYARISGHNDGLAGVFPVDASFVLPHLAEKYSEGYRKGRSLRAMGMGVEDFKAGRPEKCPAEFRLKEFIQSYHGGYDTAAEHEKEKGR